ncbi:hypothetical protein J4526_07890 [Desulfurococcaceae archaeon MEX13E-LK6-19]|nr:hypothetical protein J4526_07890 [Desulfurococcaceae archaeon MEX13E-LK6-19]
MVYRILLALNHKIEEYDVRASIYGEDGRLVDEKEFKGVKRVSIVNSRVYVSAQLSSNPFTLIIETEKPSVRLKNENILVVGE